MLACGVGPFFEPGGIAMSLLIFLVFKPLAYYGFVHAFRFRVSRAIPMTRGQAAMLAWMRALLGFSIVAVGALFFRNFADGRFWQYSWIFLYAERLCVWGILGAYVANLRGRRLLGWVVSGTAINAAFDVAVVTGLFTGIGWPLVILGGIAAFVVVLDRVGQRDELRARFTTDPLCAVCQYNLTGNLSGICPECGTQIVQPAMIRAGALELARDATGPSQ